MGMESEEDTTEGFEAATEMGHLIGEDVRV